MLECSQRPWRTNWCWLGLKRWQQYISQTKNSFCRLAGQGSIGKQPVRDLCQATVTKQLQQLRHSSERWEQDNNNSNNVCAVILYNRSRSVRTAVGGPVLLLLLWRRWHAVHLRYKVGTRYDSVNKCTANCIYSKQTSSEKRPPPRP